MNSGDGVGDAMVAMVLVMVFLLLLVVNMLIKDHNAAVGDNDNTEDDLNKVPDGNKNLHKLAWPITKAIITLTTLILMVIGARNG